MSSIIPYVVAVFSVSCYAMMGPIAKKVGLNMPPFAFIAGSCLLLALAAAVIASFAEREAVAAAWGKIDWHWFAVFTVINLVAYVGYLWSIARMPVVEYEMLIIVGPVVGGLLAVALLGEPFHPRYLLALLFFAAGMVIAAKPKIF